jgi:hypothetical protein
MSSECAEKIMRLRRRLAVVDGCLHDQIKWPLEDLYDLWESCSVIEPIMGKFLSQASKDELQEERLNLLDEYEQAYKQREYERAQEIIACGNESHIQYIQSHCQHVQQEMQESEHALLQMMFSSRWISEEEWEKKLSGSEFDMNVKPAAWATHETRARHLLYLYQMHQNILQTQVDEYGKALAEKLLTLRHTIDVVSPLEEQGREQATDIAL